MKKALIAIILVALVFGIYWALDKNMRRMRMADEQSLVAEDDAVYLADQVPGDETVVSYAKLSEPGYVLVYGTDPATGDKVVIGSSAYLPAGEHRNVRIVHRGYVHKDDAEISAVVVADDGDGVYDAEGDDDTLTEESEATVDADAQDPEDVSVTEVAQELDEAGYDVNEEVVEDATGESEADGSTESDTDTSDTGSSDMGVTDDAPNAPAPDDSTDAQ